MKSLVTSWKLNETFEKFTGYVANLEGAMLSIVSDEAITTYKSKKNDVTMKIGDRSIRINGIVPKHIKRPLQIVQKAVLDDKVEAAEHILESMEFEITEKYVLRNHLYSLSNCSAIRIVKPRSGDLLVSARGLIGPHTFRDLGKYQAAQDAITTYAHLSKRELKPISFKNN